ncbi:hypothetical protein K439DRAFT_1625461 [Ramaria rubella]|nr:hypothetical protein K439DRAFT_1625461 [Ramaria rubella]
MFAQSYAKWELIECGGSRSARCHRTCVTEPSSRTEGYKSNVAVAMGTTIGRNLEVSGSNAVEVRGKVGEGVGVRTVSAGEGDARYALGEHSPKPKQLLPLPPKSFSPTQTATTTRKVTLETVPASTTVVALALLLSLPTLPSGTSFSYPHLPPHPPCPLSIDALRTFHHKGMQFWQSFWGSVTKCCGPESREGGGTGCSCGYSRILRRSGLGGGSREKAVVGNYSCGACQSNYYMCAENFRRGMSTHVIASLLHKPLHTLTTAHPETQTQTMPGPRSRLVPLLLMCHSEKKGTVPVKTPESDLNKAHPDNTFTAHVLPIISDVGESRSPFTFVVSVYTGRLRGTLETPIASPRRNSQTYTDFSPKRQQPSPRTKPTPAAAVAAPAPPVQHAHADSAGSAPHAADEDEDGNGDEDEVHAASAARRDTPARQRPRHPARVRPRACDHG